MAIVNTGFGAPVESTPIVTSFDFLYMPQVYKQLVSRFAGQYELGWLKEFGMKEKVEGQNYNWQENNLAFDAPTIGILPTNPSGNLMLITLAAGSHQLSGAYSYPRLKDKVRLINGYEGLVIAKNQSTAGAHIITVSPIKNSITYATFSTGIAANQQFFISGRASGEGVDIATDSIIPTTTTYSNKLQKFPETYAVTFEDKTNKTWIPYENPNTGEKGNALYYKGAFETEMRLQLAIENSLFLGQGSDPTLTDGTNLVNTTEGLLETCDTRASQLSYAASINTTFYENVRRIATRNHSGDEFLQLQGENFNLLTTNFLADWGKNGGIIYANSESTKTIDAVFGSFNFGTLKVKFKDLGILNHNEMAGAPGFDYRDRAVFLPTQKKFNKKMGVDVPVFTLMYKEQFGVGASEYVKFWQTGAYAENGATNTIPNQQLNWLADCGARTAAAKEIINVRKA